MTQEDTQAIADRNYAILKEKGLSLNETEKMVRNARQLYFQQNPLAWITARLGVRPETIDWSLLPEYKDHEWDGTPNPLMQVLTNISNGTWTAVESAVGVGKTFLGACIVLWFLECWKNSRVVTVAPKEEQLRLHIWSELGQLHTKFGVGELQSLALKMEPPKDYWGALGFTAGVSTSEVGQSATRAQGFHRPDQLLIFEEMPGVADEVVTAFKNTSGAPHNILLAFGNPDSQQDTLHKFTKLSRVNTVRISALDHPNVVLNKPTFIAGAQTRQGLATLLDDYGNDDNDPMYMSRARGISPAQAKGSLIKWEWCVAASQNKKNKIAGPGALGVDVSRSDDGDPAAIARGDGSELVEVLALPCPDTVEFGDDIFQIAKTFRIMPEHIGIDVVGVGGGTADELKKLFRKPVNEISSGGKTVDYGDRTSEMFDCLRSQMLWQMSKDLRNLEQSGLVLPYDEELFVDLCTPKVDDSDKVIKIEQKKFVKKRIKRSTNKGDACVYWNWVRMRRKKTYRWSVLAAS